MIIQQNETIVFAGDSITHWYGSHEEGGLGYCAMLSRALQRVPKGTQVQAHNRGISGNKVADLLARLDEDVLSLHPDWVSILIGINDTASASSPGTPTAEFECDYRSLLERVQSCTEQIILMTPFYFPGEGRGNKVESDLAEKIAVVEQLSRDFARIYIPLHSHFDGLRGSIPPELLAKDGVHPTQMGAGMIADLWWKAVEAQEL